MKKYASIDYLYGGLLLLALFLGGCVKKFDVALPADQKQLVLNAHFTNDTVELAPGIYNIQNVQLSQTASSLATTIASIDTNNIKVWLYENGVRIGEGQPYFSQDGSPVSPYFFTNFRPKAGYRYRLVVKARYFDTLTVEQVMPSDMPVFTAVFKEKVGSTQGGFGGGTQSLDGIQISFADAANQSDYYEIEGSEVRTDSFGTVNNPLYLSSDLPAITRVNGKLLLADPTFDGTTTQFLVLLDAQYEGGPQGGGTTVVRHLKIMHITQARYLYLRSLSRQQESGGGANPFVEPSFVYSNTSSNFGVFSMGNSREIVVQ